MLLVLHKLTQALRNLTVSEQIRQQGALMGPRKGVLHLTWDNPLPLYPGPLTTQPHLNSSSLPPCQLYTPLLLLLLLLLKAVQLPWVILTWWIIKTSETLAPSGNSRLLVEEEKRVGSRSDTLLKIAWGGTLWAGLWAPAIHPSVRSLRTFASTVLKTVPSAPVHNMDDIFISFPGVHDTVEK